MSRTEFLQGSLLQSTALCSRLSKLLVCLISVGKSSGLQLQFIELEQLCPVLFVYFSRPDLFAKCLREFCTTNNLMQFIPCIKLSHNPMHKMAIWELFVITVVLLQASKKKVFISWCSQVLLIGLELNQNPADRGANAVSYWCRSKACATPMCFFIAVMLLFYFTLYSSAFLLLFLEQIESNYHPKKTDKSRQFYFAPPPC